MIKVAKKQLVLKRKEDGASLIEYAVLAALIVVAAVAAIEPLGAALTATFGNILAAIQ